MKRLDRSAFLAPGWDALVAAYARAFETRDDALVYAGTLVGLAEGHALRDRVWVELEVAALRWPDVDPAHAPRTTFHAMRQAAWLAIRGPAPTPVMRRAETLVAWAAFVDALRAWTPPSHADYLRVIDGIDPCRGARA